MGQKLSKIKENFIFLVQNCPKNPKKRKSPPGKRFFFIRSFLNLRFVDEDSADEVGELADTLLAEHGIRLTVQLRGVAGDHLRVAGVVRVLGDECGFAASRCPSLVLRFFGRSTGIALEVALLLLIDFLRTATEDATVRVMKMFLTRGQGLLG